MPPLLIATTGTPEAIASTITLPKGSFVEGKSKSEAALYQGRMSSTGPTQWMRFEYRDLSDFS
jgi:hypothetical protein